MPPLSVTFTWSDITLQGVGAVGSDVTVLTYDTTLTRNSRSNDLTVRLYLVDEGGAKICGEGSI